MPKGANVSFTTAKIISNALFGLTFGLLAGSVSAAEYRDVENVAPDSAQNLSLGLRGTDTTLTAIPRRRVLRGALAARSPFWRDSEMEFRFRAYDFNRENATTTISEASAVGTELTVRSGKWRERLSLAATWHTYLRCDDS